jgi:hypothetical protein
MFAQDRRGGGSGCAAGWGPSARCRDIAPAARRAASRAAGGSRPGCRRGQEQVAAPQLPALRAPAPALAAGLPALHRQHDSPTARSARARTPRHALLRSSADLQLRVVAGHVVGQLAFLQQPAGRVFEGRGDGMPALERQADARSMTVQRTSCVVGRGLAAASSPARSAPGQAPDRLAVLAPVEREGPARQRLAGIPFALAVMQQAARREALAQAADQRVGQRALGRADRGGVPLGASKSSMDTKVGSPPMVRRTSPAASAPRPPSRPACQRSAQLSRRRAW